MITVALGLITAIVITSSILSLKAQLYSNSSLDSVQREIRVVLDIVDVINHSRTARTWLAQASVMIEKGQIEEGMSAVAIAKQKLGLSRASLARYLAVATTPDELRLVGRFKESYESYVDGGITPLIAALLRRDISAYNDLVSDATPALGKH